MRTIFRRIAGRVIPIRIRSEKILNIGSSFYKERKIIAEGITKKGKIFLGSAITSYGSKKGVAKLKDVRVAEPVRGNGIGRAIFEHVSDLYRRAGFKFLRSDEIVHPHQVKIRASALTRFLGKGYGPYGEGSKFIGKKEALDIVKLPRRPTDYRHVQASTMLKKLPKKYRR